MKKIKWLKNDIFLSALTDPEFRFRAIIKEKQNSKECPKCHFQFIETEDFSWAVQKI